jgi:hypothetical protein
VNASRCNSREIRDLLQSIAEQAVQAQRMSPTRNENLLDAIDAMDNTLQEVIALVNTMRSSRGER